TMYSSPSLRSRNPFFAFIISFSSWSDRPAAPLPVHGCTAAGKTPYLQAAAPKEATDGPAPVDLQASAADEKCGGTLPLWSEGECCWPGSAPESRPPAPAA